MEIEAIGPDEPAGPSAVPVPEPPHSWETLPFMPPLPAAPTPGLGLGLGTAGPAAAGYLRQAAEAAGLRVALLVPGSARLEKGQPVPGHVMLLLKGS